MKNALWFVLGVAGGFVAAHVINKDPRGHEMLAEVDARITEFADRIGDAYRDQEARIEGLAADVKGVAADALQSAIDAASDVVDDTREAVVPATRTADERTP
ncbi:ATPase [Microbacterium thalli]|uniref:ATPase n=1 Tax=Microbacterium thalli TaxID=3027921 RepID=A0ABT5SIE7_9MICO|nr:ATPase [Microbacterium thalli]MDD7929969.1 ATPase [Microbacterium thalli]MDD7962573.1 ATPase [Microbacterium thalli]MDN8548659.1 ATPase [Microbacterium thalli]